MSKLSLINNNVSNKDYLDKQDLNDASKADHGEDRVKEMDKENMEHH